MRKPTCTLLADLCIFAALLQQKQLSIVMKKTIFALICSLFMVAGTALAQGNADAIVGNYSTVRNGVNSKIKISRQSNGTYRAQVTWVDNLKMPDGSIRTDIKNKDAKKRNVRADQIVLIESVSYNAKDNCWENGQIYDPTSGKTYKVKLDFKSDKRLRVRGYLGPFYESMYWDKH